MPPTFPVERSRTLSPRFTTTSSGPRRATARASVSGSDPSSKARSSSTPPNRRSQLRNSGSISVTARSEPHRPSRRLRSRTRRPRARRSSSPTARPGSRPSSTVMPLAKTARASSTGTSSRSPARARSPPNRPVIPDAADDVSEHQAGRAPGVPRDPGDIHAFGPESREDPISHRIGAETAHPGRAPARSCERHARVALGSAVRRSERGRLLERPVERHHRQHRLPERDHVGRRAHDRAWSDATASAARSAIASASEAFQAPGRRARLRARHTAPEAR